MNHTATSKRLLGAGVLAGAGAELARLMPAKKAFLLCDENTWAAAGERLKPQLAQWTELSDLSVKTLGKRVSPTRKLADELADEIAGYEAVLVVGSGTLNDLAKYAAGKVNKPYSVVATAASMNGYTSATSSLEENNFKHGFKAPPPVLVIADIDVIAAAPKRLTRAGIGDTLCRTTVEADMLLSHWLLDTPYPREYFDRMRGYEEVLLKSLAAKRNDDVGYVSTLMEALLDTGDAMTIHGSSAPASQGEHMIAHTIELKYGVELQNFLHGELIAVTAPTMSVLQQRMLLRMPSVKSMPYTTEQFVKNFGIKPTPALERSYNRKLLSPDAAIEINLKINKHWPEITASLTPIMLSTTNLERALLHSGINTKAAQINLADERYRFACNSAHMTRDRFTFLDLAAMNDKRVM